jgi:hypothetical protein
MLKFIGYIYIYVVAALTSIFVGETPSKLLYLCICVEIKLKIICTYVGGVLSISLFWRHSLYPFIEFF